MAPPRRTPVLPDKFIRSPKVNGLVHCNFYDFLTEKNAALVMFYDPECGRCARLRPHLIRAAKITERENHAYAAVDCTQEPDLCKQEGIKRMPIFKLYTRGKYINHYYDTFNYENMKRMMEVAPLIAPLHPTQIEVDPECPKKKKNFQ